MGGDRHAISIYTQQVEAWPVELSCQPNNPCLPQARQMMFAMITLSSSCPTSGPLTSQAIIKAHRLMQEGATSIGDQLVGVGCCRDHVVSANVDSYHSFLHAWQVLIAYDACVRLCLRAWAKGCMEAPEFLLNDCLLLRNSFGLQSLLLQPQEDQVHSNLDSDSSTDVASISKSKGSACRIKVQVKKIRILPRQALQGNLSQHSPAYIQAGAKYVRQVSDVVRTGVKSFLNTSLDVQEMYSCLLWLKEAAIEEGVLAHPGSGDMHIFNLESSSDNLLLEVQDFKGQAQGQCIVHVSSLFDVRNDHVRWWPIFNDQDHECIGKVRLFFSYSANMNEDSSKKCGPVSETLAYDIVLEAALRTQLFQKINLRLHGTWTWLLSEFAILYGVSHAYTSLRYLACIMEVATPTEDCLELVYDLLYPLINAQNKAIFSRQESVSLQKRMLSEVTEQVDQLLACVFESYKFLDESSVSGISETLASSNRSTSPALVPAVKIFTLLHDILSVEAQKTLSYYFQKAAKKRCRCHLAESDEFVSANNEGFLMDPMTTAKAYSKLKALCVSMCNEAQADIALHNQDILPSCIDLPNITADVYCKELSERVLCQAIADVEAAVVAALEKQYADALAPLKAVMITKKFTLQYMQKLTKRRSLTLYTVPNQAIVEKLADDARLQATTKFKKILQDTRQVGGEPEICDRMQPLCIQLLETITHLHDVFTSRVFVAICRGYWGRMGQGVLHFLENWKENRLWYKGFSYALMVLDDVFSSQMQKLQGNCLQEKDLDPPRSIMEVRSMLSKDAPNCLDASSYLYF
ncbi:hypothetical protein L7F22_049267 [Adiantum nelumboides]|nr:hypothetical protein [Adiantum nelumboides]